MKKILPLLFAAFVLLLAFVGCGDKETLNCYVPDGAPALAMANVIDGKSIGDHAVQTDITTGEEVVAKCQSGEADLAILPTNAAVTICLARTDYCLFSVNVQGLLYIVGTRQVSSLSELLGNTVYSIGFGNTPEFVFKKILDTAGVDYTTSDGISLNYQADASSILPLLLQGRADFALLGEPAATNVVAKAATQNKTIYRLFDLQQLWQQSTQSDRAGYPQAGLIVKKSLLQEKTFAESLEKTLADNAEFLQENISRLNQLMKDAGSSLDVAYTAEILQRCNLTSISAFEAKTDLERYLSTFSAMKKYLPLNDAIFYEQTR